MLNLQAKMVPVILIDSGFLIDFLCQLLHDSGSYFGTAAFNSQGQTLHTVLKHHLEMKGVTNLKRIV